MRRRRSGGGTGQWMPFLSFVAILLLGLALMLIFTIGRVWGDFASIGRIIERIAIAIALIVPLILSYYEARSRGTVWFVLWVISMILVIVFYILLIIF